MMNTSNKNIESQIFLFWSVPSISKIKDYKMKSDLLREANAHLKSVRVVTRKNETVKFKKIELKNGTFYGLKKIKGEVKKMLLNINLIKAVILL